MSNKLWNSFIFSSLTWIVCLLAWLGTGIQNPFFHSICSLDVVKQNMIFFFLWVRCCIVVCWKNKKCQSFGRWHTKRLKELTFTILSSGFVRRPLENACALYSIRGKTIVKKNSWILKTETTSGSAQLCNSNCAAGHLYVLCVSFHLFLAVAYFVFTINSSFIGVTVCTCCCFFSLHFVSVVSSFCYDGVQFAGWVCNGCWSEMRAHVSTQVSLRKMLAN